jgi:hypothetical protein
MVFLLFWCLLYFLPSIVGHRKRSFPGILLLNVFLGWTVIGWIIALVWACTADDSVPVVVMAGLPARYCCGCGALNSAAANFCGSCGRRV